MTDAKAGGESSSSSSKAPSEPMPKDFKARTSAEMDGLASQLLKRADAEEADAICHQAVG